MGRQRRVKRYQQTDAAMQEHARYDLARTMADDASAGIQTLALVLTTAEAGELTPERIAQCRGLLRTWQHHLATARALLAVWGATVPPRVH